MSHLKKGKINQTGSKLLPGNIQWQKPVKQLESYERKKVQSKNTGQNILVQSINTTDILKHERT